MIHPSALVSSSAKIEEGVEIGPYSIIHENVYIGRNSKIGAFCEIGLPTAHAKQSKLEIGDGAVIRSHTVIYAGSQIGPGLQTGHHVCVRENSEISEGVQLGSRTDVQGDCSIGAHTKMHADVHVGKRSKIGSFVWLFPEVLLTNDPMPPSETLIGPVIEDYCVIASKVMVFPGVKIASNAVVAAGSVVKNDIPEWKLASGNPAKPACDVRILRMPGNPKEKAYPWRNRFHRGYPPEVVQAWVEQANTMGNVK
ncbi:MAG: N-acetyltransferase [Actinobacteria bacterium]|nr:N-acetyltransferase [Actinomycetota bacterium]